MDKNIVCEDALFSEWVKANAIIGNPPFLGGKKLRIELGDEYAEKLYKAFPDVKGQPDFCVFWFRKAADLLDNKGRAGLVGTNSIAQVSGRKASLDYIVSKGGIIHDAISTQTWSGDAAVHVSIVNWTKEEQGVADFRYNLYLLAIAKLLHNQYFRLLAFYFHTLIQQRQKQKQRFLDSVEVPFITSSLKSETSVTNAVKLQANKNFSFESCALGGKGFLRGCLKSR